MKRMWLRGLLLVTLLVILGLSVTMLLHPTNACLPGGSSLGC